MLEKTLGSLFDCKETKPKGNQPWMFIGRTDAEAEAPILWLPYGRSRLLGKAPDAGKDWEQEETELTEDDGGWMASLNQWTWVWANSGREGRTGKPGLLQSTGSQRVRQDLATEQQLSPSRPPGDHSRGLWTGGGVFNATFFFFLPESVGLSKRYVAQFQFNGTESFQCVLITQT